jgi:hypothetical protein
VGLRRSRPDPPRSLHESKNAVALRRGQCETPAFDRVEKSAGSGRQRRISRGDIVWNARMTGTDEAQKRLLCAAAMPFERVADEGTQLR